MQFKAVLPLLLVLGAGAGDQATISQIKHSHKKHRRHHSHHSEQSSGEVQAPTNQWASDVFPSLADPMQPVHLAKEESLEVAPKKDKDETKPEAESTKKAEAEEASKEAPKKAEEEPSKETKAKVAEEPAKTKEEPVKAEATQSEEEAPAKDTKTQTKEISSDAAMPFAELEPFGRETTGQDLTEASIRESDAMIDQIEKAEIAEEERSVFRALTRLRGAALASFDGIARAHEHNIQEYAQANQYRKVHPVKHLAEEEADVSRWAFPSNAD